MLLLAAAYSARQCSPASGALSTRAANQPRSTPKKKGAKAGGKDKRSSRQKHGSGGGEDEDEEDESRALVDMEEEDGGTKAADEEGPMGTTALAAEEPASAMDPMEAAAERALAAAASRAATLPLAASRAPTTVDDPTVYVQMLSGDGYATLKLAPHEDPLVEQCASVPKLVYKALEMALIGYPPPAGTPLLEYRDACPVVVIDRANEPIPPQSWHSTRVVDVASVKIDRPAELPEAPKPPAPKPSVPKLPAPEGREAPQAAKTSPNVKPAAALIDLD